MGLQVLHIDWETVSEVAIRTCPTRVRVAVLKEQRRLVDPGHNRISFFSDLPNSKLHTPESKASAFQAQGQIVALSLAVL